MTTALLQVHQDGIGKWPTDFDHKKFQLQAENKSYFMIELHVEETDLDAFKAEMKKETIPYTFVLVYDSPAGPHSIYVRDFDYEK